MPGIEYIVVFVIAFSSGYDLGKHKNCGHQHIIVKHRPWYTLNVKTCFCLLYTSPSPRDRQKSRMPSSA